MEDNNLTGAAKLVEELDKMFAIYANEMKAYRTGKGDPIIYLNDVKMFDVYLKLLDKKDKIKSLNAEPVKDENPTDTKIRNIQDFTLSKDKKP